VTEKRTHDHQRHGTTTLFAALEVATSKITADACYPHQRTSEFLAFLKLVAKAHPRVRLHVVCDNYATHNHPAIKAWLARNPRITLHFTPTSASWLNMVERWFAYLNDQLIRRGVHTSVQALERDVRAWIKNWNDNPRPFIWTKTAEEILTSLARYISRISGKRH
jgi:transposase